MPIFENTNEKLTIVPLSGFVAEKHLQKLIETNLEVTFGCKFVASEFSTGNVHAGRIDTLALSEDGNPVIIEYKKVETSGLINQALFYLDWIKDHKGDFEIKVKEYLEEESSSDNDSRNDNDKEYTQNGQNPDTQVPCWEWAWKFIHSQNRGHSKLKSKSKSKS